MHKFTIITKNTLRAIFIGPGMCPQWSAVVGTDQNSHHSDKIATTINSLISTKISTPMKILSLNCQLLYVTLTYVHM